MVKHKKVKKKENGFETKIETNLVNEMFSKH
jgi:hypothetical protein